MPWMLENTHAKLKIVHDSLHRLRRAPARHGSGSISPVNYELLVLFEGKCGLIKTDHPIDMDESSVWLMTKGSQHGWQGDGGRCRLLSVMLDHVDGKLADVVNSRGGIYAWRPSRHNASTLTSSEPD